MELYQFSEDRVVDKFGCFIGILKYYGGFDRVAYLGSRFTKNIRLLFSKHEKSLASIFTQQEVKIFDADTDHLEKYLTPWSRYFRFNISVKGGESVENLITFFKKYKKLIAEQSPVLIRLDYLILKLDSGAIYDPHELLDILAITNPEVFEYPSKISFRGRGGRGYKYTQNSRTNLSIPDSGGMFEVGEEVKRIFKINAYGYTAESCLNFAENGTRSAFVYSIDCSSKFDQDDQLGAEIAKKLRQNTTISEFARSIELKIGSSDQYYDQITSNLFTTDVAYGNFPNLK